MAPPSSEFSQPELTPKPSFPRRHRASGLDLPRGPGPERYHPGGRSTANKKPSHNPWGPVPPHLRKPAEKAARPEPIPDSDMADGEDEEDLGTPTEAISPPTPPPPALPAPMTTSITMQGISDRPAAQPPVRSDSFCEQDPEPDTPGEKTVHGKGERNEFRRWKYKDGILLLESFDPLRDPLRLPPIRATLPDPDVGSLIPPPPRVQGEIRHALPTLEDRKAAKAVSGSAETTTANLTPPQGRKRKLSPPKKQEPAAPKPAPAPAASTTPSASPPPPAAPALPKKPHAKTKNAILRADALDGDDGEPNPDGPCRSCSKSQTKRGSCRTARDRTTGTKCNHCTRNKILCAKLPKPEPQPQPAPPPPPADYDPDETEVEEDAEDEEMRDAAPAVRRS